MTETNVNKSKNKRYYWLKLNNTYFNQLEQKKMRRQEHGKDMQIIYLRMMLLSIDKGGVYLLSRRIRYHRRGAGRGIFRRCRTGEGYSKISL